MDFSDDALFDLYIYESTGQGVVRPDNGFANGKKWMDVAVAQWREDLWRTLIPFELYGDTTFPHWWLDRVLGFKGSLTFSVDQNE
jgi:hypothetical protein